MNRLYSLDYLRGATALGIMTFHITMWENGQPQADTFLGRIGIFGVAVFYLLSGFTMFYVYQTRMTPTVEEIKTFFKKRIFRLFPLLWLVTFLSLFLSSQKINITSLLLNLSGLFGLFKWDSYIATGAWSIGNELSFYLFFPLVIFLIKNSKIGFWVFSLLTFLIFLYFTFFVLKPLVLLNLQWHNYVNPFNQAFLFFLGIMMGVAFQDKNMPKAKIATLFVIGLAIFIGFPASGNSINIVYGWPRLIFVFATFLVCLSIYKSEIELPSFLHRPLIFLGDTSYAIYLIHPLVYTAIGKIMISDSLKSFHYPPHFRFVAAMLFTLTISYLVYEYFEKFFVKLGK